LFAVNRTTYLIDGFNLYHSARTAAAEGVAHTKWLDIRSLCESYLHLVGSGATLEAIHYFSALARHLETSKPQVTRRHLRFIECLEDSGINVELSRFKRKTIKCDHCAQVIVRHEEKETDVAIAVRLIEILQRDKADTVLLVTGDTDLAPAVRAAKRLFPEKLVGFAFPYRRKNNELARIADISFNIGRGQYARYQFPDTVLLRNGRTVAKPTSW
jgi:uncharacterized LabA/DUF88 family protein